MTGADADRRRAQRLLVISASLAVLLAVSVGVVAYVLLHDSRPGEASSARTPTTTVEAAQTPAETTWVDVAGVQLPVSRTHGPRTVTPAAAAGFSRSEAGAALAAVHILIRSSAAAGPSSFEPTITRQVTGANAAAMKLLARQQYQQLRSERGVADGAPVNGDARVVGYRVASFGSTGATAGIEVFLTSADVTAKQQLLRFDVQLQWADGDWRAIAPPRGDWGSVTTVLSEQPAGLLRYGEGS